MHKPAAPFAAQFIDKPREAKEVSPGYLLINAADEIVYANKQARLFLGLLADELLPAGQKFLPLVRSAYQCYPSFAWLDWPKRPSSTIMRYLIFSSSHNASFSLLKVEVVEHLIVDGSEIWAVAIHLVESSLDTAVIRLTHC